MATDLASRLRGAYLDADAECRRLDRNRAKILQSANVRHDQLPEELATARATAHADPDADAEVDHLLEERAHCSRLGAVP